MKKGGGISILVAILIGLKIFAGLNSEPDIDKVLENAVKGGNGEMANISKMPQFSGGKCYRDGTNQGVVFEYVYSKEFSPESIDAKMMKTELKQAFKGKADVKKIAELGVYFRFVYKSPDGKVLCDVTLNPGDLGA